MTNTRITVGEVLDIAAQIGSALQAAHQAGIVHRDIKPENIIVRRDGVVKVLDFGLAKLTSQHLAPDDRRAPAQSMVQTNPGVVMGTVGYMSPEQARGQEVDARTDIWSLGVVLYELLAGRAPFGGETPSHVIVSILETEPSSLCGDGGVPDELGRIVAKALRKEREGRYQTAGELALELKNLKAELEVEARLKLVLNRNASGENFAPGGSGSGVKDTFGEPSARTAQVIPARPTVSVEYLVGGLKRHKTFAGAALLVVLVSAISWTYFAINRNRADAGARDKKSIAVLPLKPINAASRDDIYEIGIADSLIHRLSSMKGFVVRPLSATRQYREIAQDPIAAGKVQQVDYVLASNYQLADGKIGITAQLFNVASGQIEQTYRIEKDSSNVFAMQDAIAMEIGNKLLVQFATTSNRVAPKRGTTNEEAYRLYLQGMYLANARNPVDAKKSVEALEQAVGLDPNYAVAWAGLAYAQRALGLRTGNAHEAHQKSMEAINRALALDPNLSEAHSALCENQYLYDWDFVAAERSCIRAIELNPDSSQAHEIFSRFLMGRGRHDEAIAEIKTAIDLEPTSRFFQRNYGRALYYARRYPEAVAQFKRVNEMDRNVEVPYLSITLAMQGKESEAFESFMKLLSLEKADEEIVQALKTAFQTSGWQGVLRERAKRFEKVGGFNFDGAADNAQIGNKDKAFEYLQKVYQQREYVITYLQVDPRFDSLRDDPRYAELVRRIESK
jgi:serine/threonine-protein kinase